YRARRTHHKYAPTARELAVIKNPLPRRQRSDWHRCRGIEINLLWLVHKLARRRRHILGITAAVRGEITINLIARCKIFNARPVRRSDGLVPWRARRTASPTRTPPAGRLRRPSHLTAKDQRQLQPEHLS